MRKVNNVLFFELIRDFLILYLPKQRCFSANTIKSYKEAIYLLLRFFKDEYNVPYTKICFELLNRNSIMGFLKWLEDSRGNRSSTVNQRLMALKSFFKYAASRNPVCTAQTVEILTIPIKRTSVTPIPFLSEGAVKTLFAQPQLHNPRGVRDRFFMILMYDTAARCQELLDLRLKDIDICQKNPIIYLTGKGSKTRIVPLMDKTVEHYADYIKRFHSEKQRKADDFLFYTVIHGERQQMSPDNVASFMKRYGEQSKLSNTDMPTRMHPHLLRHTRAMHLYRGGMPLVLLQEFLGHSSLQATQVYAYADTAMKREALEKISTSSSDEALPIWQDDEEIILKLYGIK